MYLCFFFFFFQAEDGIRDFCLSRGLGDVYKRQGSSWKKFINVYNIGESNTWTTAPNESKAASSYVGNDNSSIVPVSTGYWAAQYRGGGSNSPANPCMFYYSDQYQDAVFNTAEPNIIGESSQNGALAVNEKEQLIALSVNGGVAVYSYLSLIHI